MCSFLFSEVASANNEVPPKKQTNSLFPIQGNKGPQDAAPIAAIFAVRPVTKRKAKKVAAPKKVKPTCEALVWYGDIYPANIFEFLLTSTIGQTIYKHLKADVKPSFDCEEISNYFIEMPSTLGKFNDISLYMLSILF